MRKEEEGPRLEFQEPIHILGAGSIGLLWAASIRSAFPSYPVQLLLREHRQIEPSSNTITISLEQNKQRPRIVHVPAAHIGGPAGGSHRRPIRNLVLTTKAFQARAALTAVLDRLNHETTTTTTHIIILCNGALAVRQILQKLFQNRPRQPIIHLAMTTHGAYRHDNDDDDEMYHVVHAGQGRTWLQAYPDMAQLWNAAGLQCQSVNDSSSSIERDLWYKLAANCVINPLTALHGCTNGQLPTTTTTITTLNNSSEALGFDEMTNRILQEVSTVAAAVNNKSHSNDDDDDFAVPVLRDYVDKVLCETRDNKSSMWQDILARRPTTEIEFLNGFVVQEGRARNIPCPVNQELVRRVQALAGSD